LCAGEKHLNRLEQVLARREARQRGLDEVILHMEDGYASGGSMTNVLALSGGRLVTPPIGHTRVAGVMRAQVLAVARRLGLPAEETPVAARDLAGADALWLTNARMGLWPVATCEGREFGASDWTLRLQRAVRDAAAGVSDA
jgi:4-amino-4-deoxychorismate lyase